LLQHQVQGRYGKLLASFSRRDDLTTLTHVEDVDKEVPDGLEHDKYQTSLHEGRRDESGVEPVD